MRNFVELFPTNDELLQSVGTTTVACIGPITAATAREAGLTVQVRAGQNTVPALADAIVDFVVNPIDGRTASAVSH